MLYSAHKENVKDQKVEELKTKLNLNRKASAIDPSQADAQSLAKLDAAFVKSIIVNGRIMISVESENVLSRPLQALNVLGEVIVDDVVIENCYGYARGMFLPKDSVAISVQCREDWGELDLASTKVKLQVVNAQYSDAGS